MNQYQVLLDTRGVLSELLIQAIGETAVAKQLDPAVLAFAGTLGTSMGASVLGVFRIESTPAGAL